MKIDYIRSYLGDHIGNYFKDHIDNNYIENCFGVILEV